jgi:hypothetical protein
MTARTVATAVTLASGRVPRADKPFIPRQFLALALELAAGKLSWA